MPLQPVVLATTVTRSAEVTIEWPEDAPHTWYGPSVHQWTCNSANGLHVCIRGARTDGRAEPGPHRCACGHRWAGAGPGH